MPPKGPADLKAMALKMATESPHKTLPTPRLVQLIHNHTYIARTTSALYVWEHPYFPQFYLPAAAFPNFSSITSELEDLKDDSGKTVATRLELTVGDKTIDQVAKFADDLSGPAAPIAGMVKIMFNAVDQWLEEATPIAIHPKDPFKRIDILASTRRIRVSINGTKIAETTSSMHLYETGLPARFYMPLTCLDVSLLRPSETRTGCPYKGEAEYYSVQLESGERVEDCVWYYERPTVECAKIEGLCCFYNEKVDIELDGVRLERPETPFSKGGSKPLV